MIETPRRKFAFKIIEYHLPSMGKKRQQAKAIMSYGIKHNRAPTDVLQSLKNKGLGYRKTNFLEDYAKAQTTETSKTHQSYERAKTFWGGVKNIKARDDIKTYSKSAKKLKEYSRDQATLTPERIEELEKLSPDHRNIFGDSP